MQRLALVEGAYMNEAMNLLNDNRELKIMLGGEGFNQIQALAEVIKQESKMINYRNMFRNSARNALRKLGEYQEDPDIVYDPCSKYRR